MRANWAVVRNVVGAEFLAIKTKRIKDLVARLRCSGIDLETAGEVAASLAVELTEGCQVVADMTGFDRREAAERWCDAVVGRGVEVHVWMSCGGDVGAVVGRVTPLLEPL
jgi:hypothetical protein